MAAAVVILKNFESSSFPTVYGITINFNTVASNTRQFFRIFIIWFPLLYLWGIFAQINTGFMYFLEQINIHLFGSTGSRSLSSAIVETVRNIVCLAILVGLAFASDLSYGKGNPLFSLFLAFVVALSFFLSRTPSDPQLWNQIFFRFVDKKFGKWGPTSAREPHPSSYPLKRFYSDLILSFVILIFAFLVHVTTVFRFFHPHFFYAVASLSVFIGWFGHYFIFTFRKTNPLRLFQRPIFQSSEHALFEPPDKPAEAMWFDQLYYYIEFFEKSLFYPLIFFIEFTEYSGPMRDDFGLLGASILLSLFGLKLFRSVFSEPSRHWLILLATLLFFKFDARRFSEGFPFDYFLATIVIHKLIELINKINFILIYCQPNPENLSLGSAAHFFLAPLVIPHFASTLFQAIISTLLSAPLYPFIGSVFFFTSYGRPVRFWERDYETQRTDSSQIKLSDALEGISQAEYNVDNLDSIFYEHLTTSLRLDLCTQIESGRFGDIVAGDFLIIGNDRLTAMVHIIERGNGHVTFQLRGMEFKSTYCHERELEAVMSVGENATLWKKDALKQTSLQIPNPLGLKRMLGVRWNSWETVNIGKL